MAKRASIVHSSIDARNCVPFEIKPENVAHYLDLQNIGFHFMDGRGKDVIGQMMDGIGMDAGDDVGLTPSPGNLSGTTASITTPIQFLQNWLPGFVRKLTAARKIDECVGIMTAGSWEDEEIVQGILEPIGTAQPYGDYTNIPMTSWNTNFVTRGVVRFEQGMMVGLLEEARAARIRIATAAEKRAAAGIALDIQRNRVGFYGYNDGAGASPTYGFLNDTSLPAYNTVANGATSGSPLWSTKTFIDITADIRTAMAGLQLQSQDQVDVQKTPITFAVANAVYQYLTVTAVYGNVSVRTWLQENYPNIRIVSAPELSAANGGANVGYFYADTVDDGGSDGGKTFVQVVPSKFQALGVEKRAKSYIEDYANATAGVMCKRPFAVYRFTGI